MAGAVAPRLDPPENAPERPFGPGSYSDAVAGFTHLQRHQLGERTGRPCDVDLFLRLISTPAMRGHGAGFKRAAVLARADAPGALPGVETGDTPSATD